MHHQLLRVPHFGFFCQLIQTESDSSFSRPRGHQIRYLLGPNFRHMQRPSVLPYFIRLFVCLLFSDSKLADNELETIPANSSFKRLFNLKKL
jgi:hypothetical protein